MGYFDHKDVPGHNDMGAVVHDEEVFASEKVTCIGAQLSQLLLTEAAWGCPLNNLCIAKACGSNCAWHGTAVVSEEGSLMVKPASEIAPTAVWPSSCPMTAVCHACAPLRACMLRDTACVSSRTDMQRT